MNESELELANQVEAAMVEGSGFMLNRLAHRQKRVEQKVDTCTVYRQGTVTEVDLGPPVQLSVNLGGTQVAKHVYCLGSYANAPPEVGDDVALIAWGGGGVLALGKNGEAHPATAGGQPVAVPIREEGVVVISAPVAINFVGDGVTASTDGNGVAIITIPGVSGGIDLRIEDEGATVVASATGINFVGSGVVATTDGSSEATVTITGGGSPIRVEDEGSSVVAAISSMNFAGAGVTVTDAGSGEVLVTIPAGTGGAMRIEDEGSSVVPAAVAINFAGAGVTVTNAGSSEALVTIPAGGAVPIRDEGTEIVAAPVAVNFAGAGVTVTDVADVATVTIPGGSGVRVEDEGGSIVAAATGINFAGAGVTVTDAGSNEALITIPGGAAGALRVEDEGSSIIAAAVGINFAGAGVTVTNAGSNEALITIPGATGSSGLGPGVLDASTFVSFDAAIAALIADTTKKIFYMPPGQTYQTSANVNFPANVNLYALGATLQLQAAGARFQVADPSAYYFGLFINGNDVATNPLKFGTTGGGAGAKCWISHMQVQNCAPNGTGIGFHNLQNSYISNLRAVNCEDAGVVLLIDDGSKNLVFDGFWASGGALGTNGPNIKITTSTGSQRTSKIFFRGGLCEQGEGVRIEDCEQVYFTDCGYNSGPVKTQAFHLVAGGNRDGTGAKMPSSIGVFRTQIKDWDNAFHVAGLINNFHVGECSLEVTNRYKVEHTGAKIYVTAKHFLESGTRFTSGVGAVEDTVIKEALYST